MFFLEDSVLRDLKALLIEAKQKVPPFLLELDSLSSDMLELGGEPVTTVYCDKIFVYSP